MSTLNREGIASSCGTLIPTYSADVLPATLAHSYSKECIPNILTVFLGRLEGCSILECLDTFDACRTDLIEFGIGLERCFYDKSVDIFQQLCIYDC